MMTTDEIDSLTDDELEELGLARVQATNGGGGGNGGNPPGWRKNLEDRAKRGDEATQRADQAERRLAIAEAGVPTKSRLGRIFADDFDGDVSDDAAIKAAWEAFKAELGVETADTGDGGTSDPPDPTHGSGAGDGEVGEHQRAAATAGGAGSMTPDQEAEKARRYAAATSREELDALHQEYGVVLSDD